MAASTHTRLPAVVTAIAIAMAMLATLTSVTGCNSGASDPIVVGYLGGLSSRASSLGVAGRDGALLAVEEANAAGGVNGRSVRLAVADDATGATASVDGVRGLAEQGAIAIVGPMTSGSAVAAVPVADAAGIALISPTVSTDALAGIDDQFLRIYPTNDSAAKELAAVVTKRFGCVRVAVIYDLGNKAHTESWLANFRDAIRGCGNGEVSFEASFVSGENPDYTGLARDAVASGAECVFLLANSIDSAMLCQRIRIEGSSVPIVASEWSSTDDLVSVGGGAVDGMVFLQTYDQASTDDDYLRFVDAFRERFGYNPGFAALHAYDATRMVLAAAENGTEPAVMKRQLLDIGTFAGVQGAITLDSNGDVKRAYSVMTIDGGRFVRMDPL